MASYMPCHAMPYHTIRIVAFKSESLPTKNNTVQLHEHGVVFAMFIDTLFYALFHNNHNTLHIASTNI